MNDPHSDSTALQRDLFAQRAARLRRRLSRRRSLLVLGTPLLALSFLYFSPSPDPAPSTYTLAVDQPNSDPVTQKAPVENQPAPEPEGVETLSSDQELMAAVADQGPLLITHPDGRKQLILTRPR